MIIPLLSVMATIADLSKAAFWAANFCKVSLSWVSEASRSLISLAIPKKPVISPSRSRRAVIESNTGKREPFLRIYVQIASSGKFCLARVVKTSKPVTGNPNSADSSLPLASISAGS